MTASLSPSFPSPLDQLAPSSECEPCLVIGVSVTIPPCDPTDHSMPLDTLLSEPGAQEAIQGTWRGRSRGPRGDGCHEWGSARL